MITCTYSMCIKSKQLVRKRLQKRGPKESIVSSVRKVLKNSIGNYDQAEVDYLIFGVLLIVHRRLHLL